MSNLIFPMPVVPQGAWTWPVKKTPSYKTIVQTPASNRGEVRVSLTPNPIYMFEYDFSYLKGDFQTLNSAIANLMGFYQAVRGASDDWLFQDTYDKSLLGQLLGYGNGSGLQFQIGRTLAFGGFELMQNVFPTAMYINGVSVPAGPQASGNQWYCGLENQLLFSQAMANAAWTPSATGVAAPTATDNAIVAPDGTTTADSISYPATGAGQFSDMGQTVGGLSLPGATYTFSVWLKVPSGTAAMQILVNDLTPTTQGPLSPVTVTTTWQRFSITTTFTVGASPTARITIRQPASSSAVTLHAWGAQLERWPSATSYVATTSVAPVIPRGLANFYVAPGAALPVTADFTYYYRCRFLEDELADLEEMLFQLWNLKSLKFKSIIL